MQAWPPRRSIPTCKLIHDLCVHKQEFLCELMFAWVTWTPWGSHGWTWGGATYLGCQGRPCEDPEAPWRCPRNTQSLRIWCGWILKKHLKCVGLIQHEKNVFCNRGRSRTKKKRFWSIEVEFSTQNIIKRNILTQIKTFLGPSNIKKKRWKRLPAYVPLI